LEHKDELLQLAKRLLEKEVLFKEDLEEILGPRPFAKEETVHESEKTGKEESGEEEKEEKKEETKKKPSAGDKKSDNNGKSA